MDTGPISSIALKEFHKRERSMEKEKPETSIIVKELLAISRPVQNSPAAVIYFNDSGTKN